LGGSQARCGIGNQGQRAAGFSGDGGPATAAKLNRPLDVTTDHLGNVYILDGLNNRIRKIAPPPPSAPVAGFSTTAASVCEGNCLTFNSTSTGAIDSMRWVAPGATVSMPTFTGTDVCFPTTGSFTVHLYVYGPGGVDSSSVDITVSPCASTTGIGSYRGLADDFWLSQEHAGVMTLNSSQPLDDALSVTVFDMLGRKLLNETWNKGASSKQISGINTGAGLYVVRLGNRSTSVALKWLKYE
jgi:PKD repeat protein